MIDSHAHLEQPDYSKDLHRVIERCKKAGLIAIMTSCAHPKDFEKTMKIADKYSGYVFPCIGIHPEYIKEASIKEVHELMDKIKQNKNRIYGIGEIGLDYFWVKEPEWQKKQKELFAQWIDFAKELEKPLIIHSREAMDDTIKILEKNDAQNVLMHLFGSKKHLPIVIRDGWNISIGPLIKKSKEIRKIARDMPIEKIMLETDSPWFGEGGRGEPTNIKIAAEYIARFKKLEFDAVWKECGQNSIRFFRLPLKI